MHRPLRVAAAAAGTAVLVAACGGNEPSTTSTDNYPTEPLEVTVAFGPGGGSDIMARKIVDILEQEEIYTEDIEVVNKDGGSGSEGWSYLQSQTGDPYQMSPTSGSFLTTPLEADTGWTYEDFTPVGLVAQDDLLFAVAADSGITTWKQWVQEASKDASGVPVGGIGTVNVDFINHSLLAEQAGYEISYVPFDEEGQLITGLQSGSLEAIVSNPAEILGQVESGDMNPLLFTGDEPLRSLPDVPTASDLGYEGMVSLPRGVILAPDVPAEVQDWWIDAMQQVVETPAWQAYLEDNQLNADLRWGDDFTAYMETTTGTLEEELSRLGALDG